MKVINIRFQNKDRILFVVDMCLSDKPTFAYKSSSSMFSS